MPSTLLTLFSQLPDPRRDQGKMYPLGPILVPGLPLPRRWVGIELMDGEGGNGRFRTGMAVSNRQDTVTGRSNFRESPLPGQRRPVIGCSGSPYALRNWICSTRARVRHEKAGTGFRISPGSMTASAVRLFLGSLFGYTNLQGLPDRADHGLLTGSGEGGKA